MKLWSLIHVDGNGGRSHVYSYSDPGKIPDLFIMKSKLERDTAHLQLKDGYEVVESIITHTIAVGSLTWHPVP